MRTKIRLRPHFPRYAVRAITYLAGKPLTSEQISNMDNALMHQWGNTTKATPYVVGGAVALATESRTAGMWAKWGTDTLFNILADEPSHKISTPPIPMPGMEYLLKIINGIDMINPTPLGDGTLTNIKYHGS